MADGTITILAVLTKSDEKARGECRRLRERGAPHGWEVFPAECYRSADGGVVMERSPVRAGGSLSALADDLAPDGIFICGNLRYFDESGKLSRLGVPIVSVAGDPGCGRLRKRRIIACANENPALAERTGGSVSFRA